MHATYTISSETEIAEISLDAGARDRNALAELSELELAFVGGGTGDVCF